MKIQSTVWVVLAALVAFAADPDFENGKMQYTVTFTGNAMDFGKALGKSKFKTKALRVTAVKNNLVEVAIAK